MENKVREILEEFQLRSLTMDTALCTEVNTALSQLKSAMMECVPEKKIVKKKDPNCACGITGMCGKCHTIRDSEQYNSAITETKAKIGDLFKEDK